MASSDVDLLRNGFEALAVKGHEAMVPLVHPDFEMETPAGLAAEPQRYQGVEGFRLWWTSFLEVMNEVTIETREFHDLGGGQFAIESQIRAIGGASGIETTQPVILVATLRDEKIARIDFAITLEDARAGKFA
jgi:ketosteroid isomerase-like protein